MSLDTTKTTTPKNENCRWNLNKFAKLLARSSINDIREYMTNLRRQGVPQTAINHRAYDVLADMFNEKPKRVIHITNSFSRHYYWNYWITNGGFE